VATYENKLSRKATEASVHLATESRTIAEQSKHIAVLTRRDSNDMRIIALLTMIFLPGAFVGTFFSSSFFNFGPAAGNAVVSHWIWLYLLITALLTIIVFSGWHLLSRAKSKKEEEFI
jgi:Mg2+ and Co2+ transporter CorA